MNELFPVFLKLEQLNTLIIGGGYVGLEKVTSIFKNSPSAQVTLVAGQIKQEIHVLAKKHPTLLLIERDFIEHDLENRNLIIVGTNDKELNRNIKALAKKLNILTNVADTPQECDFYLGSVVIKGDLKVAISTNGKSPTLAKRMRELMEDSLPAETQDVLNNLEQIRNQLKGDFEYKLKRLNDLTLSIFNKEQK